MLIVLVVVLVLSILNTIALGVLLSGFWDLYKRTRLIDEKLQGQREQEVSEHLQDVGRAEQQRLAALRKRRA